MDKPSTDERYASEACSILIVRERSPTSFLLHPVCHCHKHRHRLISKSSHKPLCPLPPPRLAPRGPLEVRVRQGCRYICVTMNNKRAPLTGCIVVKRNEKSMMKKKSQLQGAIKHISKVNPTRSSRICHQNLALIIKTVLIARPANI